MHLSLQIGSASEPPNKILLVLMRGEALPVAILVDEIRLASRKMRVVVYICQHFPRIPPKKDFLRSEALTARKTVMIFLTRSCSLTVTRIRLLIVLVWAGQSKGICMTIWREMLELKTLMNRNWHWVGVIFCSRLDHFLGWPKANMSGIRGGSSMAGGHKLFRVTLWEIKVIRTTVVYYEPETLAFPTPDISLSKVFCIFPGPVFSVASYGAFRFPPSDLYPCGLPILVFPLLLWRLGVAFENRSAGMEGSELWVAMTAEFWIYPADDAKALFDDEVWANDSR